MRRNHLSTSVATLAALVAFAAVACGGGTSDQAVPTLPGGGSANTAEPPEATEEPDPWAGRDLIDPPEAAKPSAVDLPEIERFTLKNGLEVRVIEDPELPVVGLQLAVRAGQRDVPRDKTGLARFAASMLTKGTEKRDAMEIAEAIDFAGGSLSARASHEATWVSCEALSKDLGTCLSLVPDVVGRATFPKDEMPQVRKNLRAAIRQRRDSAGQMAAAHFQNALWGADHVRGWIMSDSSLAAIQRKDLVAWHDKWFSPKNATLAVAGDVDAGALRKKLERAFRRWRGGEVPERPSYDEPAVKGLSVRLVNKPDQTQSHIRVGHLGISHDHEDFFDVLAFNYALGGGGFSSRLMKVVRADEGKTYGASSHFDRNSDRGAFVASTFTRTPETVATAKLVLQEIEKMAEGGPTEEEVQSAITHLAGSYQTRFETASDVASALLAAELHGFGEDYVRNFPLAVAEVTAASAREAADEHLDPGNMVMVIVGNAQKVGPQLDRAGWSYETVDYAESVAGYERDAAEAERAEPIDPESAAAAEKILDKALEAKGGYDRLSSVKTMVIEGKAKMQMGPQKVPAKVERVFKRPSKMRFDIDIRGGLAKVTTAYDGDKAWMRQSQQGRSRVIDLPAKETKAAAAQVWRDVEFILLRHRENGVEVEKLDDAKVGGEPHHVVRVVRGDGIEAIAYIDKKSYLIRKMEYPDRGQKTTETFGDYRTVDGLEIAHQRSTATTKQGLEIEVTNVAFNKTVDDARFDRPEGE